MKVFIVLETNTFGAGERRRLTGGTNTFCSGVEHFTTGDELVENVCSNLSHNTHTATCTYTSDFQIGLILR